MSYNRGGYIGRAPSDSSVTVSKQYFESTGAASTFTFSSGYDPGYIDVYRNGIKLVSPLDYSATNGSTITLSTPVGIGTTIVGGDWTVGNTEFNEASKGKLKLDVDGSGTITANDFQKLRNRDKMVSKKYGGRMMKRAGGGMTYQLYGGSSKNIHDGNTEISQFYDTKN